MVNAIIVLFTVLILQPFDAVAWNIPAHMLSGCYSLPNPKLENPSSVPIVRSVLEKNPWYQTRWKTQLEKVSKTESEEMLFMLAGHWADDIRTLDKAESRLPWHYVDFPFKPEGEPASIQAMQPPKRISSQR